jgi:hypothetical protein
MNEEILNLSFSTKKSKLRQSSAIKAEENRRHSLRLAPIIKQTKPRPIIRETRMNDLIISIESFFF